MLVDSFSKNTKDSKPNVIKLLLADDHEMVLDIARMYLNEQKDMAVTTATSATEAFKVFQTQGPFDVVLLDYQMPGMDGLNGLTQMLDLCDRSVPVGLSRAMPIEI